MIGVLQETEATADNTAVELTNQREQLARITEDVTEIDSLLTRADRLVKVFSKRMMTDKVRFFFLFFLSRDVDRHFVKRKCFTCSHNV